MQYIRMSNILHYVFYIYNNVKQRELYNNVYKIPKNKQNNNKK